MSSALGDTAQVAATLRRRLNGGLRQIAFFVVPSRHGFCWRWATSSPLCCSRTAMFTARRFALRLGDPRRAGRGPAGLHARPPLLLHLLRPARHAHAAALRRDPRLSDHRSGLRLRHPAAARWLGIDRAWGVAGLTGSAGVAGWVEFALLRRTLNRRIGSTGVPAALLARLWGSAALAAAGAWGSEACNRHGTPRPRRPTHPLRLRGPLSCSRTCLAWKNAPARSAAFCQARGHAR